MSQMARKSKPSASRRTPEPITIAEIMRSPVLQRPGVAIPSDDRARDIVARLALAPFPALVQTSKAETEMSGAPKLDAPRTDAPDVGAVDCDARESDAPISEPAPSPVGLRFPSPGLSGFTAPADTSPVPEEAEIVGSPHVDFDAPKLDAPYLKSRALDLRAPKSGALNSAITPESANSDAPLFEAPNSGAPKPGPEIEAWIYARSPRAYVVQRGARAEDSFTIQEQRLLDFLWRKGRELPGVDFLRIAGGGSSDGARVLAAEAGVAYSTFQLLTRTLRDKFALDIIQPGSTFSKVYAVYATSAILERQRATGYDSFIKQSGGGRLLVNAQGDRCPARKELTVEELKKLVAAMQSGASKFGAPTMAPG